MEARLYQQRSRQYELLQPILLRVARLGIFRFGWGITPQPGGQASLIKGLRAVFGES